MPASPYPPFHFQREHITFNCIPSNPIAGSFIQDSATTYSSFKMTHSQTSDIKHVLESVHNLREGILTNVIWEGEGTTLSLYFNSVLDKDGNIRLDLEREKVIMLKFELVQEFHLVNALNDFMLKNPGLLNWGLSEVAMVTVVENSTKLKSYESPIVPLNHIVLLWEGERRIDIIFSRLTVEET